MRKLYLFLILIFLVGTITALTYKQSTEIDLKIPCFNNTDAFCSKGSYCNITVYNPASILLLDSVNMTNQGAYFNATLSPSDSSVNGEYSTIIQCTDGIQNGFSTFNFNITPNGEEIDEGTAIFRIGLIVILLILLIFCAFGFFKVETPFMKTLFFGIGWLLLTALFYICWVSSVNFFYSNQFIGKFFYWGFVLAEILLFPLLLLSWGWYFYLIYKLKPIQKMIDSGVPTDEIYERQVNGGLS